jgi:hypothetical protein
MLLITSIVAALLSLILVKLSFAVISLRRQNKVSLGSGGNDALERAIRAQANFTDSDCLLGSKWRALVAGAYPRPDSHYWTRVSCLRH